MIFNHIATEVEPCIGCCVIFIEIVSALTSVHTFLTLYWLS